MNSRIVRVDARQLREHGVDERRVVKFTTSRGRRRRLGRRLLHGPGQGQPPPLVPPVGPRRLEASGDVLGRKDSAIRDDRHTHRRLDCGDVGPARPALHRAALVARAPVHGNGGTPALADNKLIFSCDGARDPFVIALNTQDGSQAWKVDRSIDAKRKFSFSTPLVLKTTTGTQVLLPGSDMIGAYDPANGKEIWRATYDGYSVVPRPVVGHGMVFFSTGFDRAKAMAVQLGGKGDVTETHVKWILPKGAPHTPSMVLTGNELYMVSDGGIASCVDAKNGEVHWSERLGGGCSASPILANGKLYQVNEAGTVYVLEAGKEFNLLSQKSLGERSLASPAVAHGSLYIRTAGHLWRFE